MIKHWMAGTLAVIVVTGLLFSAAATRITAAQPPAPVRLTPIVGYSLFNDRSPALRDMLANIPLSHEQPTVLPLRELPKASSAPGADPVVQSTQYPAAMPALVANFEGITNTINILPPDTNGDIGYDPATGHKYYFQTVNVFFQFWDVTNPANPVTYGPPAAGNSIWHGAGGNCELHNDGDIIGLFDSIAHRWIFSQFAVNLPNGPYYQCIAVSVSADPLGSWYRYSFLMPDADMNDYPKLGVWPDAYYMTDHQFKNDTYDGAGVFAFDRAKMLDGLPTSFIYFNLNNISPWLGGHLPADLDGLYPPPAGAPGLFMELDHGIPGDGDAYLMRIWEFHADFTNPANSTFGSTESGDWALANYKLTIDPFTYLNGYLVPQKDTGRMLDAIGDRLMYRLSYRNMGTHQLLVGNQTVDAGSQRAGIRWFEMQDSGSGWAIRQQGTYAPNDGKYRWMGSIASDANGNLALGYSISSSSTFPSINYAGRLVDDPPGQMAQGEAVLVNGTGSQTSVSSRWGDYSSMSVDPLDDCTFWYTNEYYVTTNEATWHTRIGAFRFANCRAPVTGTLSGVITNTNGGAPLSGATVTAGSLSAVTGANGHYALALPPATYTVTVGKYGFLPYTTSGVVITSGGTVTRDFALSPSTPAVLSGHVWDGSGHGYPLYTRLDISAPGYSAIIFTDPVTGAYQANLFQGQAYTLRVSSQGLTGYTAQATAVTPTSAIVALNFNLQVDPACTAPGYQLSGGICSPRSGGLATGFVTDANYPAVGLNGAYVSSGMGEDTSTFATPLDPSVGDGMYVIFQPTTDNTQPEDHFLGADLFPYSSVVYTVNYHPNGVVRQDFALPAGQLSVLPASLEVWLEPDLTTTQIITITDTGTANAYFSLQTLPLAMPAPGPFEPPVYVVEPADRSEQDAADLELPPAPDFPAFDAGLVLDTWLSGLSMAWGIATDAAGKVWVSSPAPGWGGVNVLVAYHPSGGLSGEAYPYTWNPANGPADLAFNPHTGSFWVVNVAEGDNCIYEMSPLLGYTGRRVCPDGEQGSLISPRGLAYDPASDTFYTGSWNDEAITQFGPDGTLLRRRPVGLAISGLAYNPDTRHLFVMVNAEVTKIYVLDTANDFAPVGAFTVDDGLLGTYSGAGLEMSCDGSLWLTDQSDGQVYQVTSGEITSLCTIEASWFSVNPQNGYLAQGEHIAVTVTFDSHGLSLGDYIGQILVTENTPYVIPNLPITMHVQNLIRFYLPGIMKSP